MSGKSMNHHGGGASRGLGQARTRLKTASIAPARKKAASTLSHRRPSPDRGSQAIKVDGVKAPDEDRRLSDDA